MITMLPREQISLLVFLFLFVLLYGLEALLLVRYALARIRGRSRRNLLLARPALALHALAAVGIVCLLYGWFIEPYWIDVHVTTVRTPKLKSDAFRIVQVSDLHCDRKARNEKNMVRLINDLKPDIVVATGDYLNHHAALARLRDSLRRLEAPLGKFGVTGNWDVHGWPGLDLLEGTGFRRLEREAVVVTKGADSIGILGMDFVRSDGPTDPIKALARDRFNVFLFHTPDLIEDVRGSDVDLYLCGHTHGGQVALPWYGALITFSKFGKKYESGLHQIGETTLYVNRGLGLEPSPAPPVRFFARPEIAVFDIVPAP
jgi:hypothetical protein